MSDPGSSHTQEFERLYQQRLAAGQTGWNDGTYDEFEMRPFIEHMLARSGIQPPAAVLDLGCGTGQLACMLAALDLAVTGIDISPAAITYARHMAGQRQLQVDFRVGDLYQDALPRHGFDVAIDARLLHCIVSYEARSRLLARICEVLRPGGELWSESMVGRPQQTGGQGWRLDEAGVFWKVCLPGANYPDSVPCGGQQWIATRRIPLSAEHLAGEFIAAGFEVLWQEVLPPAGPTDVEMCRSRCRVCA